jgi:hypothetical protein
VPAGRPHTDLKNRMGAALYDDDDDDDDDGFILSLEENTIA